MTLYVNAVHGINIFRAKYNQTKSTTSQTNHNFCLHDMHFYDSAQFFNQNILNSLHNILSECDICKARFCGILWACGNDTGNFSQICI